VPLGCPREVWSVRDQIESNNLGELRFRGEEVKKSLRCEEELEGDVKKSLRER
jgi:hypothetical protein